MAEAAPSVISHWYQLLGSLQASPKEFYASIEQAIERRNVPDAKRSRVDWREGGLLSAKREYLRVQRREYTFDICGAPFGTGFFVSWWLVEAQGCLANIPGLRAFLRPKTYYRIDTALMFQSSIHGAVLEVVDELMNAKGLRALSELERKPILQEFVRR
jgi:hypothetical protein